MNAVSVICVSFPSDYRDYAEHVDDDTEPDLVRWRRDLHQSLELSFEEFETTEYVAGMLDQWGIPRLCARDDRLADDRRRPGRPAADAGQPAGFAAGGGGGDGGHAACGHGSEHHPRGGKSDGDRAHALREAPGEDRTRADRACRALRPRPRGVGRREIHAREPGTREPPRACGIPQAAAAA